MLPRCRRGGGWQHLTISGDGQRRAALALSRCTQLRLRQGGRGVPRCAPVRDPKVDEGLIDEADQNPSAHLGVIEAGAYAVRQGWKLRVQLGGLVGCRECWRVHKLEGRLA
jgi:hypothetical protein